MRKSRSIIRKRTHRRGSALLVCTLAAAVLSMATIAIVRCNGRSIARVDAVRNSIQGRVASEGLMQRTIATLRVDPAFRGVIRDDGSPLRDAYADVNLISPNATQIQIYLYNGSRIPAIDTIVDPDKLSQGTGGGNPGGTKPKKDKKDKKGKKGKKAKV